MERFTAIEGARAWLAWAVVISHIAVVAGIQGNPILMGGSTAVICFMIVSGFVITHLLESRPEGYGNYLIRRFFRLFPLFVLTCMVGYFTNDLQALVLAKSSYYSDPTSFSFGGVAKSNHAYFWQHLLAHATMMHGAVSDTVLPYSSVAFNGAAWSISLEWQFYILAPLIVALCKREYRALLLSGVALIAWYCFHRGWLGSFGEPSLLPAAAGYFAIGIASRLAYPRLATVNLRLGGIVALAVVILPLIGMANLPLLFWLILFGGLISLPTGGAYRMFRICFESEVAVYLGSRSYSTYLVHMPVITLVQWATFAMVGSTGPYTRLAVLSLLVIPAVLVVSELTYRLAERPGIHFGSWLARQRSKAGPGSTAPADSIAARGGRKDA